MTKKLVLRFVYIASIVALCVLTLSSLLGFLGAKNIFLDFFAHPRLQYTWAALLLVVIFGLYKKWKYVGFAFVVMAFNFAFLLNYHSTERTESDRDLRIMSANIFYFNKEYDTIAASVRDADPDVLILIEIDKETFSEMEKRLPEYGATVFDTSRATFGIAGFVKDGTDVDLSAEYLSEVRSASVIARLRVNDKPVTVLGVHTVAPTGLVGNINDRKAEIESFAEFARSTSEPLVIIGDYNDTTFSPTMKPLWDAGLKDSRKRFELDLSWPTFFPSPLRITIDHALIKNGVKVVDRELGKSTNADHVPLILDIAL